jgi:hypothetical protein
VDRFLPLRPVHGSPPLLDRQLEGLQPAPSVITSHEVVGLEPRSQRIARYIDGPELDL